MARHQFLSGKGHSTRYTRSRSQRSAGRRRENRSARLRIESLEGRVLLAGVARANESLRNGPVNWFFAAS
jgi:hypothetical protein